MSRSHRRRQISSASSRRMDLLSLKEHKSKYALEGYKVYFSDQLVRRYEPIVYAGECMSGDPEALYYRILQSKQKNQFCIQYFYYWEYQNCMMTSHGYDYEPIFIYVESDNDNSNKNSSPYLIVNGGLGNPNCRF